MVNSEPLISTAVRNAGLFRGSRACGVLASWAIAVAANGGEPLGDSLSPAVRAYAKHWRTSERTAWRELKLFREAFPDEQDPGRLAATMVRTDVVTAKSEPRTAAAAVGSFIVA